MSLWRAYRTNRAAPAGAGLPMLARSLFNFVQPGNVLNLSYSLRDREVTAFLCSSLAAKVSSIFVSWVSWPSEWKLCRPNLKNSIRARCIAIGIVPLLRPLPALLPLLRLHFWPLWKLPATSKKQRGSRKMTTIRRFSCNDLLRFASVNFDHLTETVKNLPSFFLSKPFFLSFHFPSILLCNTIVMNFEICTVQYVILHDLFGKVARLFPCRWRSRKQSYGLQ